MQVRIMMFGDGADGAEAVLRLVTPTPPFAKVPLRVGSQDTPTPALVGKPRQ